MKNYISRFKYYLEKILLYRPENKKNWEFSISVNRRWWKPNEEIESKFKHDQRSQWIDIYLYVATKNSWHWKWVLL